MKQEVKEKRIAVLYARVSTNEQDSYDVQLKSMRRYCEYNNITIFKEFSEVRSVTDLDAKERDSLKRARVRPVLSEVFKLAALRKFNTLLVYHHSRLSREPYERDGIERELLNFGIEILATEQSNDPFAKDVQVAADKQETRVKRARVMLVINDLVENKKVCFRPPFGYRILRHRLVIDKPKDETVRRIYKHFRNGKPLTMIASDEGLGLARIKSILTNETYLGKFKWNKKILYENTHEPIVDVVLFEEVQAILKERTKKHGVPKVVADVLEKCE